MAMVHPPRINSTAMQGFLGECGLRGGYMEVHGLGAEVGARRRLGLAAAVDTLPPLHGTITP